MKFLSKKNIKDCLSKYCFCDIKIKDGIISIEKRQPYCNRGAFVVKIFPAEDQYNLFIDKSDMFPRYYFDLDCMLREIALWIKKNRQEYGAVAQWKSLAS